MIESLTATGCVIRSRIVWANPRLELGRGHHRPQYEPCRHAVRKGATGQRQGARDGVAPEPALPASDWADKHRMLGYRGSAEPEPWRTNRTPHPRDVMDALSPAHPARRVVFMEGAQVGGTECGNNWIGYAIHHAPGPMLAVQPTTEPATYFSDQRIDSLAAETPAIRERVAPARSRNIGNRQRSKEFPGGQLVMTGANSTVGLRCRSTRSLFLDDVEMAAPA